MTIHNFEILVIKFELQLILDIDLYNEIYDSYNKNSKFINLQRKSITKSYSYLQLSAD